MEISFMPNREKIHIYIKHQGKAVHGNGGYTVQQSIQGSSILLLVANGYHNCIKCAEADVRLRTPDDGQRGCPKHVE